MVALLASASLSASDGLLTRARRLSDSLRSFAVSLFLRRGQSGFVFAMQYSSSCLPRSFAEPQDTARRCLAVALFSRFSSSFSPRKPPSFKKIVATTGIVWLRLVNFEDLRMNEPPANWVGLFLRLSRSHWVFEVLREALRNPTARDAPSGFVFALL